MENSNLDNILLSLLFAADEPLTVRKMVGVLGEVPASDVKSALDRWKTRLDDESWSIMVERVAGGYQLSTRPEYAPYVAGLYAKKRKFRLSKAGLETLAIISYKQPITRAEIETLRGVSCGGVIASLMERSLIKIVGKARVLGAPFLYGSTPEFLEYLGLNALKDLPSMEELEALLEQEEYRSDDETERTTTSDPNVADETPDEGRPVPHADPGESLYDRLPDHDGSPPPDSEPVAATAATDLEELTPDPVSQVTPTDEESGVQDERRERTTPEEKTD